jgi:hypothetical protein
MIETTPRQGTEAESYEATRFNALRHGVLSRFTVLPWEDQEEYCRLLNALVAEHKPKGPTEEHLIEEMAGVLWRKRRLRLAEASALRQGLESAISSDDTVKAALAHLNIGKKATAAITDFDDLDQREAPTVRALDLLQAGRARAYDKALGTLSEETRRQWEELIKPKPEFGLLQFDFGKGQNRYTADAGGLHKFLQQEVMPRYQARRRVLENGPLIREQVIGEALDPVKLEGLARYEIHLDRKLERMLTMLIRLQELRTPTARG